MNKNYSIVIALMMFFNLSLFSQDGPPWDFNGTDHGFVASNYTALAVGDTYLTYSINSPNDDGNGGSPNPNFKKENAMLDTSPGNFIAVTLQNLTANTRIVVILTKNGNNTYTNFDGLTPNNEGFVTHYINVGGSANWNGEVDAINFRFKQGGGVNNNVYSGDILFDHIEVVDGIPSTPRTDYTFDDTSDAEGFVGGNGVSLSQPNAGSIVANISANSPYPKFEQSGIYSVDADAYKYIEITLTNNSTKNRITLVSPNGGNQFAGSEMVAGEQMIYLDLSELTNWNGTYSNWWLQLVENPGDGPIPSAGEVIIDRILFTDVDNGPAEPNFVTADPSNAWGGYMEVFNVNDDGSQGGFVFGEPWGVADLQTVLQPDVPNMTLHPNFNTYNAEDPFWSNGEMGNKIMRATTQVESWDMYNGADLTFTGSVAEHTLEGYDTVYFIKCLDPDAGWSDMLEEAYVLPLPDSGEFSVSVSGDLLPAGKLVQFGFSVIGLNANPASDYGKVVIGDVGLSIGENDSLDMVIYPNPVDGDYVTIQTPLNGDKLVEVFDVNGRKVMERLLTTDTLNVSSISAGMYIVKVTVEDQSNVSKLIIE